MIEYAERPQKESPVRREAGRNAVQLKDNRVHRSRANETKEIAAVSQQPVQRPIGSGGVVQRKVYYAKKKIPNALKNQLQQATTAYNSYSQSGSNTRIALHKQFELLNTIENAVNTYLRNNAQTISDEQRAELFGVLRQAESDHIKLTGRLQQHGHDIWLGGTGLSPKKQAQTQRLWHSLRQNQGNVKIQGNNAGFKTGILSGYARMLRGDHGRGLLRELNRHPAGGPDPSKHIRISSDHKQQYLNLNKGGDHKPGSWQESYGGLHHLGNRDDKDGTGTGSYVQIQYEKPTQWKDYQTDTQGKPLHEPKFITLAHELGHARHALRGNIGYSSSFPDQMDRRNPLRGRGQELERRKWTGQEEFNNITHEENPVRKEHGLSKRKYHSTKSGQIGHANQLSLETTINKLDARLPQHAAYAQLRAQLGNFLQRLGRTDTSNAQQVQALRTELNTYKQNLPANMQWAMRKFNLKSWIPSKKKLVGGAIGLGALGLYAYNKWWPGK